jgi:hypothetical protein
MKNHGKPQARYQVSGPEPKPVFDECEAGVQNEQIV